jgi:hypothetical protein
VSGKGNRKDFWHELRSAWWKRYPWKLDDDKEPPTNDPDEMLRLASVEPDEAPTKKAVETQLTKVWFLHRCQ